MIVSLHSLSTCLPVRTKLDFKPIQIEGSIRREQSRTVASIDWKAKSFGVLRFEELTRLGHAASGLTLIDPGDVGTCCVDDGINPCYYHWFAVYARKDIASDFGSAATSKSIRKTVNYYDYG